MVKKYNISSEVIVLVCLLTFCSNSSSQYDKFNCNSQEYSTIICYSSSSGNAILPVERIPHYTKSLVINSTSASLVITIADIFIFRNLKHLQRLLINIKSLYFPENFFNSISKNELEKWLFSAPKLETFLFKYTEYSDENYAWVLPATIKIFHLTNRVFNFDLHSCRSLSSIRLNSNKLSDVPSFENPLTLLELDLRNNSLKEFSVENIAGLCMLRMYAMDAFDIGNCECKKLKIFIQRLQNNGNFAFEGSFFCNDFIGDIDMPQCLQSVSRVANARGKCLNEATKNRPRRWRSTSRPNYEPSSVSDNTGAYILVGGCVGGLTMLLCLKYGCNYFYLGCRAIFTPATPRNSNG